MVIGKTRTNQPVEGDAPEMAKALEGQDLDLGDVTATTLSQAQANKTFDIGVAKNSDELTYTGIYMKAEVINQVLWIVLSFKVKNETGATVSASYNHFALNIDLDDDTAKKIYTLSGKSCFDFVSLSDNNNICSLPIYRGATGAFETVTNSYITNPAKNRLYANVYMPQLTDDGEMYFSARIPLTLI